MGGPIRIVLLGAGRMGRAHLDFLLQLPDLAHVVAAADVAPSARNILETEYNLPHIYADPSTAVAESVCDAVFITLPNHLHAEYALVALEAGRHVFVEKPMALKLADVDAMITAAAQRDLLLMSGQTLRFAPHLRFVKQLIDRGALGRLRHVIHRRLGSGRGGDEASWFARQAESGGILPGIGVHSLDVILWWLGEPATSVFAAVRNIDPHPAVDIEDEASLIATTVTGVVINVALSFHHRAGTTWTVAGDEGVIDLEGNSGRLLLNGIEQTVPSTVDLPGEQQIQREFLCAIREQRQLLQAAGDEIRQVMALVFAAQESGCTGRAVDIT